MSYGDYESGFLFLEECNLSLLTAKSSRETSDELSWPSCLFGHWLPLHLSHEKKDEKPSLVSHCQDSCPHCHLTIECRSSDALTGQQEYSFVIPEPTSRFDGTVADLKPSEIHCTCDVKLRQRTDGALLLGLVLSCQDIEHIVIRSIEVLLKAPESIPTEMDQSKRHRQKASILITIDVPEIQLQRAQPKSPAGKSRRRESHHASPRKRFITKSSKPLPANTQLLLSILRSDWAFLNNIRKNPQQVFSNRAGNASPRRYLPFFPSKLALDEVYQRIGSASSACFLDHHDHLNSFPVICESFDTTCADLPKDVWQYHIGGFLTAKSLDSLRCSSKYFRRILQEVVPGLRLRLYSHQVKSLFWMRLRETKKITEDELSRTGPMLMDDIHNAATGGATVLLRKRMIGSSTLPNQYDQRISQWNGEEVILQHDDHLSRNVARGGLLCDDPGLGKTITVLSLILQTFGLSTSPGRDNTITSETYEEQIFTEYWKEQFIPQFRCQALNKLFSTFIRNNHDSVLFMFPVNAAEDAIPDYFEVISNPLCFQDIRKRINNFQYDHSFSAFVTDVIQCFR